MIEPRNILIIKAHSLGIGDVLRASASWRVLRERWPQARLHLLFLSKHPGYVTESLIREHPLLASAHFMTVREGDPSQARARRVPWLTIVRQVRDLCRSLQADLIIDTESAGLRTAVLTWLGAQACGATTVGVGQFPLRRLFYDLSAPSTRDYMTRWGLTAPMDYTHRDFVPLAALGLSRNDTPIELAVTQAGEQFKASLKQELASWLQATGAPTERPLLGLNIGCGTPDAAVRRPDLDSLVQAMGLLAQRWPHTLLLCGAPFERENNQRFMQKYAERFGDSGHMIDKSGACSLSELTGLIAACDAFVTSDSGPYHMAVGLRVPTLVWFNYDEPAALHQHPWCKGLITPAPETFTQTLMALVATSMRPSH
jgi:ADP-heptose:LPS heptosyltransferase